MWTPDVIDKRSDVIAATYKLKRPVRRQLIKTVITTGVTVNYDICLYKDGVLHTSVRAMLGNPSFYSSPESYAASNYVAAGAQAFYDVAISDGVAVVVSFPGWYERLGEKSATAYCSVFITGAGFERFSIRTVTSQGTVATAVPVDDSHDPNYKYLLTVDSGSGQWIADLSAMDRYRTLYEFNLSQYSGSEVVPVASAPATPVVDISLPPPTVVPPGAIAPVPVDDAELRTAIADLTTLVNALAAYIRTHLQGLATNDSIVQLNTNLRSINTNVMIAGQNASTMADYTVNKLADIEALIPSRSSRLLENAAINVVSGFLTR